ncbi:MAG: SDR family oxidoreductase [Roseiflexaceae bacterium]
MMRRILITGGAGYLGSELVRQATAQGWEVAATYFVRRLAGEPTHATVLDIRDEYATERVFAAFRPDIVIHTAFRQSEPDLWTTTADGTGVIARAARRADARLIHISSDALFDGMCEGRYTEEDAPCPITPYGEAKAAAERLVSEHDPRALIVRTSLIYGGATPSVHEQLVLDAADGRAEVVFFRDELRCPVVVSDLAAALLELASSALGGVLHVAGTDVVSRYDFARRVAAAHGRSSDRLRSGLSAESGMRRPRNCALDCSRAQGLLRTRLRGVREVLSL